MRHQDVTRDVVVNNILKKISLKLDKEKLTAGLTREYFEDLYNKGNYELLVIKLCVRLEAVLKCDFHYEGTFEEMLTKFLNRNELIKNIYDFEDDSDIEIQQSKIFHKLRKYRNSIVHAEKNQEELSQEDIKKAIAYVFNLG